MKIDEIIKKSIEIPGISIKRGEFSAELILKERDGNCLLYTSPSPRDS